MNNALGSLDPGPVDTVFLDRDGVINRKMPEGQYVTCWDQFQLLPRAVEAIALLNRYGFRVIVVSNQRGIALGIYTAQDVLAIHAKLQKLLEAEGAHIDGFYFCPHDKGQCNCRKPGPGLFEQARAEFPQISAARSIMIGDSLSDMAFGHALGMLTAFIEGDPALSKPGAEEARTLAHFHYRSLYDAVADLLFRQCGRNPGSGSMCLGVPGNSR